MSAGKVKLETTSDQFHELTLAANAKRGTLCKVNKKALAALLLDHGRLIKYAQGQGILEGHL